MDRHRSLYKENSSMLSPRQHKRINRDLHHANRTKQRENNYQSGRNFEVSPREKSPTQQIVAPQDNKENTEVVQNASTAIAMVNKSRIALAANGALDSKKLSHKEAYLLRFMEWRETKKKNEQLKKQERKRPFIPSGFGGSIGGAAAVTANHVGGKCKDAKAVATSSFVPKNHKGFQPPTGLKNPALEKLKTTNSSENGNSRRSLYTVVPTPPKKKKAETQQQPLKRAPFERRVLAPAPRGITPARTIASTAVAISAKSAPTAATRKPAATEIACSSSAVVAVNKRPASSVNVSNGDKKAAARVLTYGAWQTTNTAPTTVKTATVVGAKSSTALKTLNKPRQPVFAVPAAPRPPTAGARIAKPVKNGIGQVANKLGAAKATTTATGAVGKARQLQRKRDAQTTETTTQRNAKLAVSFKAKNKPGVINGNRSTTLSAAIKRNAMPNKITINGKTLLAAPGKGPNAKVVAETPTDLANLNPFAAFVTSTKVKSPRVNETLSGMGETISPVKTVQPHEIGVTVDKRAAATGRMPSNNSSAKRALLQQDRRDSAKVKTQGKAKKKFNFVRYSVGQTELDMSGVEPQEESVIETVQREKPNESTNEELTAVEKTVVKRTVQNAAHESTVVQQQRVPNKESVPPKSSPPKLSSLSLKTPSPPKLLGSVGADTDIERPANYLSPYVSVSRGKVSSRKEREKRDSVYLQHPKADDLATTLLHSDTPASVEARRTLETVRYFRQQLANEIERLHALCAKWEQYKEQELTRLQQNGGDDMINVTIGQTKLLTSKKFQQFNGLIDRCEAGAHTLAAGHTIETDGSENTKPITAVDLEGFWSMMGLQVENVEKRFENLERWKANDWCDPDEVVPKQKIKTKPSLNKVKKPKAAGKPAKASSALLQMLHQMHAEKRKNKATALAAAAAAEAATEAAQQQQMHNETNPVSTPKQRRQRRSQSGTPRDSGTTGRISVVVRDRKMHSAAATVISIPATAATQRRLSRSSLTRKTSLDTTPQSQRLDAEKLRRSIEKLQKVCDRNELLRTVLIGGTGDSAQKQRRKSLTATLDSAQLSSPSTAVATGRKSILKTPGTAKGKQKNVIFNDKLHIRKFNFTLQDEQSDDDEAEKKSAENERIYSLRTRKVVLRPSSEFDIPK